MQPIGQAILVPAKALAQSTSLTADSAILSLRVLNKAIQGILLVLRQVTGDGSGIQSDNMLNHLLTLPHKIVVVENECLGGKNQGFFVMV